MITEYVFNRVWLFFFWSGVQHGANALRDADVEGHEGDGERHEDGRQGNEERIQEHQHRSDRGDISYLSQTIYKIPIKIYCLSLGGVGKTYYFPRKNDQDFEFFL